MDAKPILVPKFLAERDLEAIGAAITMGYRACDSFMKSNVVTDNFMVGMDQRSRLISVFVEFALTKLDGFTYELKPNAAHNCWHTRIFKNQLALTAHFLGRGNTSRSIPNSAINRAVLSSRNLELFADESNDADIVGDIGYCWILHSGFMTPKFAGLAIPSRNQSAVIANTPLPLVDIEPSAIEQVREEMTIKLLTGDEADEESTG